MSKELQQIIKKIKELAPDSPAVLATVVDVQGSSYRLPGARMLIAENGQTYGTVSGGCLESDVLEHARQVLRSGKPTLLTYDTTGKADSVFSLNMGCNGIIRILLEPLKDIEFFKFVENCFETRIAAVVAHVVTAANETAYPIGSRIYFTNDGEPEGGKPPLVAESIARSVKDVKAFKRSVCEVAESENGDVEFFLEFIQPPVNLVIFGAGYDAVPVAAFAKDLGWRVTIVDHRPAFASAERFSAADELIVSRPEALHERLRVDEGTVAVVMTHNYSLDREIIVFLLTSPAAYVGALGPKKRTENLLNELQEDGVEFSGSQLARLFAPIGLDIGGTSPETIALSIIAEIQSVLTEREGGFLRARQAPIYDRRAA
jgi:xanthine dehydrogenase accessory factor